MYDYICKFLAENFASDFACWIFGEPQGLTKLSPTELFVDPIRADALILLQSSLVKFLLLAIAMVLANPSQKMEFIRRFIKRSLVK